jgi:hypothetical protein
LAFRKAKCALDAKNDLFIKPSLNCSHDIKVSKRKCINSGAKNCEQTQNVTDCLKLMERERMATSASLYHFTCD